MEILDYTSFDEVRAVLGVNDEELEDATIALDLYVMNLRMELETVDASIPDEFATVSDLTSRNANEQRFYEASKLFATYVVAKSLGSSLPMFGPKDISDGKATVSRFADSPYRETMKRIENQFDKMRQYLESAFAAYKSTTASSTTIPYLVASTAASDPVTGT